MASLASQLDGALSHLRALQPSDGAVFDRSVSAVLDLLIENENYRTVWDERLLAQAEHLLTEALENAAEQDLIGLRSHLSTLRETHSKLYAVLDSDIDLESLLLDHLANWSVVSEPLQCNFAELKKSALHQARISGDSEQRLKGFFDLFVSALKEHGFSEASAQIELVIRQAIEGYRRLREWQIYALFALGEQGDVYGLKVNALPNGQGHVRAVNHAGTDMETSARKAVAYVASRHAHTRNWDFQWEINRSDIQFDGESIGLGLTLATLMSVENIDIDRYTAFTGKVDTDGNVRRIEHLNAKLQAARQLGIRRVFIPRENSDEAEAIDGLKVVSVASIDDALRVLKSAAYHRESTSLKVLAENKIQELEIVLKASNVWKIAQIDQPNSCIRVEFTDRRETIPVMIYHAQQIKHVVQGKESPQKRIVQAACDDVFGKKATSTLQPVSSKPETRKYTVKETMLQHRLLEHLLKRGDSIREVENNCVYRIKITIGGQTVHIRQFTNGTLTVTGISPLLDTIDADVRVVIGASDMSLQTTQGNRIEEQIEAVQAVELGDHWIGTDEAGKGDYYGPLVAGAVLLTTELAEELRKIGVKDSKSLSDKRNIELAETIRRICGKRAQVVVIPPERYNALYEQFQREGKNLNTLLAWGHTRALEDILTEYPQQQITVIVDKFGDEHFVRNKLLSKSRQTKLNLVQLPKAEANIAVAAASILARAQFLQFLTRMSDQYKIDFPKGASDPRIMQIGREIIVRLGDDELRKVAKLHFATTQKIRDNRP